MFTGFTFKPDEKSEISSCLQKETTNEKTEERAKKRKRRKREKEKKDEHFSLSPYALSSLL